MTDQLFDLRDSGGSGNNGLSPEEKLREAILLIFSGTVFTKLYRELLFIY